MTDRYENIRLSDYEALQAECERLRKDAARWRYARDILTVEAIETAQSDFINFGLPASESESARVDQAIDAAMQRTSGGDHE